MKWITRSRVHVDRVACPWLIKRFIDLEAEFIFVTKELVMETAQRESAIPFDIENVELGHKDEHCTFVTLMDKYKLNDSALRMLADVVNAADTDKLCSNIYAPGLEAIARGFSFTTEDDFENLEYQFRVYDALYTFFRIKTAIECVKK